MIGFTAFLKKELIENIRNYRLFIMISIFIIFGFMSPLLGKFTPQLMETFMPELASAFENPTAIDSWTQFYKNVSSLGFSLTIILFSSSFSTEYAKGTLIIMLTKGLSRKAVVLSKFLASSIILTISYLLSFCITYGYTVYFWPEARQTNVFFGAFLLWVAGLMFLCILTFGCVIFRQAFTSILFLLVLTVIMSLPEQIEATVGYSPVILFTKNIDLLSGEVTASYFSIPIAISAVISVLLLIISIFVFNKKQL